MPVTRLPLPPPTAHPKESHTQSKSKPPLSPFPSFTEEGRKEGRKEVADCRPTDGGRVIGGSHPVTQPATLSFPPPPHPPPHHHIFHPRTHAHTHIRTHTHSAATAEVAAAAAAAAAAAVVVGAVRSRGEAVSRSVGRSVPTRHRPPTTDHAHSRPLIFASLRSFGRSFVRSFARSLVRSFVRLVVGSLVGSLVRLFARFVLGTSSVLSVRPFVRPSGRPPARQSASVHLSLLSLRHDQPFAAASASVLAKQHVSTG